MTKYLAGAALCALLLSAAPAQAQDYGITTNTSASPYLALGLGEYDVFDDDNATDIRVEYRSGTPLFWEVKPWGGLEATTDGSIWAGGGLLLDLKVAPAIYVVPSVGVGLYTDGNSDKDLGSPVEFRTQLEGGYEFASGQRVGVALSHTSNLGLDNDNPGTEVLNVYYSFPINSPF